jgi:uncharacterized protein (TIGR00255 family)
MLSMTGYGRGRAALGGGAVVVELRAVNHRFLDLRVRTGNELFAESALIEDIVRKHAQRGRIDVSARVEGSASGTLTLDRERAKAAFVQLRALRDELAPGDALPLSLLAGVPALFIESGGPDSEARERAVNEAVLAACVDLERMRRTEGAALAKDLASRNERIAKLAEIVEAGQVEVAPERRKRMIARVEKLLADTSVSVDMSRIEMEIALLAERADVAEELTRLRSHTAQLSQLLLAQSADPIGRRIEFLLQEMSREANTAGSKLPDAALTQNILELKAELERMREQVQNIL